MDLNSDKNSAGGHSGSKAPEPVRIGSVPLDHHCHICAFFHSANEEYPVLLPFIKEGLERGEKAFHIVDPQLREDHLERLRAVDIDTAGAEHSGQLELKTWHEAYLTDGHFDQDRMLALLQGTLDRARQEGYPLARLVAHMEWALEDRPGVDDIVEYEARLNYFMPFYSDPVVCVYDLAKFGADTVIDIMRTHPMIIIGGVLQENPFYIPPDQFLSELRKRKNGSGGLPM